MLISVEERQNIESVHTNLSSTVSSPWETTGAGAATALRARLVAVLHRVVTVLDVDARGGFKSVGEFIRRVAERVETVMIEGVGDVWFGERRV